MTQQNTKPRNKFPNVACNLKKKLAILSGQVQMNEDEEDDGVLMENTGLIQDDLLVDMDQIHTLTSSDLPILSGQVQMNEDEEDDGVLMENTGLIQDDLLVDMDQIHTLTSSDLPILSGQVQMNEDEEDDGVLMENIYGYCCLRESW
eukprot:46019_1